MKELQVIKNLRIQIRGDCLKVYEQLERDLVRLNTIETRTGDIDQLIDDFEKRFWASRGALASATKLIGLCDQEAVANDVWEREELALVSNLIIAEGDDPSADDQSGEEQSGEDYEKMMGTTA